MDQKKYSQKYTHICEICKKEYHPFRRSQKYCSKKCAAIGRDGKTKKTSQSANAICGYCGQPLYRKGYLKKISKVFFCDRNCQKKYYVKVFSGEGNPNFRNSQRDYSLGQAIRGQRKGKAWRKAILKRDGYKCQLCGSRKRLEVDHIYPLKRIIEDLGVKTILEANKHPEIWDIDNGRVLCHKCHIKVKTEGEFRMAGKTPTQRTLEYYRKEGWTCEVIERWIRNPKHPAGGFRKDWMGFGDILAMGENSIIAIQSCGQAFSAHNKKITEDEIVSPNAYLWLKNGGRLLLIGWRKIKLKRGGKAMRWQPRIKEYTLKDFE